MYHSWFVFQLLCQLICAPSSGFVKINVNAAVNRGSKSFGVGVIARDETGLIFPPKCSVLRVILQAIPS